MAPASTSMRSKMKQKQQNESNRGDTKENVTINENPFCR
jgi:hypothetical protein